MKSALRPYQNDLYISTRDALKTNKSVLIQLATGGGKTPISAAIIESVFLKDKRAWFITPRRNLVDQASEHLRKWGVQHGRIDASSIESRAYKIFVVSKETLSRRWDKIKNWPDIILIDEAHMNLDFQLELYKRAPLHTKFILFTATPERLDGRGLSIIGGGIADTMVQGPSIPELTRQGYLTPLRYFSPPLEGLRDLKTKGIDYDEEQLEELLTRRKIYGEVVGHYEKYGKGKAALGFCRSVKSAYQMAERFRDKGHNFHCIEGKMTHKEIKSMLDSLSNGTIEGLTTCDLVLYGVDVPRVEYGFSVRPTLSFSLLMQMIGRTLRPFKDEKTGYVKEDALWFDHVNMLLEHGINGVPPHYVEHIDWNFDGTEKRKKSKSDKNVKLCQFLDFMYCTNVHCSTCEHNPDKSVTDARRQMIIVPAELEEVKKPVEYKDRPLEFKIETEDKITEKILEYKQLKFDSKDEKEIKIVENKLFDIVDELCEIAETRILKAVNRPFWVYYTLAGENKHAVQIHILAAIQRAKNFKPGWIYFAKEKIKGRST
jgi:DNA repair protein RadD